MNFHRGESFLIVLSLRVVTAIATDKKGLMQEKKIVAGESHTHVKAKV